MRIKAAMRSARKRTVVGGRRNDLQPQALEARRLLAAHIVGSTTVYSTIQSAVDAAVAGATITVDAGAYAEKVSITKTLTIKGAQAGNDARQTVRTNGTGPNESIVTGATTAGVVSTAFYVNANN